MKVSQMYRAALIATMMLILSRIRRERIRSDEFPAKGQKYCSGSRRLGRWIVLV